MRYPMYEKELIQGLQEAGLLTADDELRDIEQMLAIA
jgi:hypothetical protein